MTSLHLQDSSCDPLNALNLLKSLKNYILNLRNTNEEYKKKITELGPDINCLYRDEERTSKKNVGGHGTNNTVLRGSDKFKIETPNIIIDKFCSELDKQIEAYKFVSDNFLFITKLCVPIGDLTNLYKEKDTEQSMNNFVMTYKNNVDNYINNEIKQFNEYLFLCRSSITNGQNFNLLELWSWFNKNNLIDVFLDLYIAFKIYLTVPSSNCSAERAFSKLKRIENKYRTTMNI